MEQMLKDSSLRNTLSQNGLEYTKKFCWENIFENFWEEITSLNVSEESFAPDKFPQFVNLFPQKI